MSAVSLYIALATCEVHSRFPPFPRIIRLIKRHLIVYIMRRGGVHCSVTTKKGLKKGAYHGTPMENQ